MVKDNKKTYLPRVAYEVLEHMIKWQESGEVSFNPTQMTRRLKKNISYSLDLLIERGFVNKVKRDRKVILSLSSHVNAKTMDNITMGINPNNSQQAKITVPKIIVKSCPYKGRRYEDVESGTYDAALADNRQPSKQYNRSLQGGSLGVV